MAIYAPWFLALERKDSPTLPFAHFTTMRRRVASSSFWVAPLRPRFPIRDGQTLRQWLQDSRRPLTAPPCLAELVPLRFWIVSPRLIPPCEWRMATFW